MTECLYLYNFIGDVETNRSTSFVEVSSFKLRVSIQDTLKSDIFLSDIDSAKLSLIIFSSMLFICNFADFFEGLTSKAISLLLIIP